MPEILVDQSVAKKYFEKEVDFFRRHQDIINSRGWKVERIDFPFFDISFMYNTNGIELKYLTLSFDLKNYNILPISVEIIYPEKFIPHTFVGVGDNILRLVQLEKGKNVLLNHHITKKPFICMKGTYEYHIHSQHEKTYWDVFRYSNIGSLYYLVNSIWQGSTNRVSCLKHGIVQTKSNIVPCIGPVMK